MILETLSKIQSACKHNSLSQIKDYIDNYDLSEDIREYLEYFIQKKKNEKVFSIPSVFYSSSKMKIEQRADLIKCADIYQQLIQNQYFNSMTDKQLQMILYNLGWLYFKIGFYEKSKSCIKKCQTRMSQLTLLLLLMKMGNSNIIEYLNKSNLIDYPTSKILYIANADQFHFDYIIKSCSKKNINLPNYYNLALYFKNIKYYQISEILFQQIVNTQSIPIQIQIYCFINISEIYEIRKQYTKSILFYNRAKDIITSQKHRNELEFKINQIESIIKIKHQQNTIKIKYSRKLNILSQRLLKLDKIVLKKQEIQKKAKKIVNKNRIYEKTAIYTDSKIPKNHCLGLKIMERSSVILTNSIKMSHRVSNVVLENEEKIQELKQIIQKNVLQQKPAEIIKSIEKILKFKQIPNEQQIKYKQILIQNFKKLKKYKKAIDLSHQFIKRNSNVTKYLLDIGSMHLQMGQKQSAVEKFLEAAQKGNLQGYSKMGELFYKEGYFLEAGRYFEKKIAQIDDTESKLKLAHIYSKMPQFYFKAIQILKEIISSQPRNENAVILLGSIYHRQANYDRAVQLYQTYRKNNLVTDNINHLLGLIYLQNGNHKKAYDCFLTTLRINPNHVPSLIQIANFVNKSSFCETANLLKNALHIDPNNQQILRILGRLYEPQLNLKMGERLSQKDLLQIGDVLQKNECILQAEYAFLLAHKDQNLKTNQKLGDLAFKKGDLKNAQLFYNRVLKKFANTQAITSTFTYKLAQVKYKCEQYDQALSLANRSLQLRETTECLELAALCYQHFANFQQAIDLYKRILADQKGNPQKQQLVTRIKIKIGTCFYKLSQFEDSRSNFKQILSKDPRNSGALDNIALIDLMEGFNSRYCQKIQKLLMFSPNNDEKRMRLIKVYNQLSEYEKAKKHIDIILKQNPHNIEAIHINNYILDQCLPKN